MVVFANVVFAVALVATVVVHSNSDAVNIGIVADVVVSAVVAVIVVFVDDVVVVIVNI